MNKSVSIAKAIGIILMVLAHAYIPLWGQNYINMFHMPLFFFFSGYCFKDKYLLDTQKFVKKRIQGIWFPYIKWGLFFLLLHNVFYKLYIYNQGYSMHDFLQRIFDIIIRMTGVEQLLGGYWFLHTLFWASLIAYFFIKKLLSYLGVILIISFITLFLDIRIPFWGIGAKEFLAVFFFVFGYVYKKKAWKIEEKLWIIPLGILLVAIGTEYWQCSMLKLTWQKLLPYAITAIVGTLVIFSFSVTLSKYSNVIRRILIYIGDNTLSVLTWHFLSFKFVSLLIIYINQLPINRLSEFPVMVEYALQGWWLVYWGIGLFVPLGINYILKKIQTIFNK